MKNMYNRFISGSPPTNKIQIENAKTISLEVAIRKLKNCYEQSKHKAKPKLDFKRNEKFNGKWPPKRRRPKDESEKENVSSYKKFNVVEKGEGSQPVEQQNIGDGRGPLQCWICGKYHYNKGCQLYQGGRPHIYNAQEAQTIGDVGHSIPWIYAAMDNKKTNHQASIIEMEEKLCDKVIPILIDIISNYSYVNLDLVDKCGFRKQVHAESCWCSWLQLLTREFIIG